MGFSALGGYAIYVMILYVSLLESMAEFSSPGSVNVKLAETYSEVV